MLARCLLSHENGISYMSGWDGGWGNNVHIHDHIDVMLRCGWVWGWDGGWGNNVHMHDHILFQQLPRCS